MYKANLDQNVHRYRLPFLSILSSEHTPLYDLGHGDFLQKGGKKKSTHTLLLFLDLASGRSVTHTAFSLISNALYLYPLAARPTQLA